MGFTMRVGLPSRLPTRFPVRIGFGLPKARSRPLQKSRKSGLKPRSIVRAKPFQKSLLSASFGLIVSPRIPRSIVTPKSTLISRAPSVVISTENTASDYQRNHPFAGISAHQNRAFDRFENGRKTAQKRDQLCPPNRFRFRGGSHRFAFSFRSAFHAQLSHQNRPHSTRSQRFDFYRKSSVRLPSDYQFACALAHQNQAPDRVENVRPNRRKARSI
jgi:hypothetical protein